MSKGKHAAPRNRWSIVLLVVLGVILLSGAGSAVAAYHYDHTARARILPGVSVDGVDVGNMTRRQAIQAVSSFARDQLARTITIKAGNKKWHPTFSDLGAQADVARAVDAAFHVADGYSWVSRVFHRLTHQGVSRSFGLLFDYDPDSVHAFVHRAYHALLQPAQDSQIALVNGSPAMVHSHSGRALKPSLSRSLLADALRKRTSKVTLPMEKLAPKINDHSLGKTLLVNVSRNMLYLYDGFKQVRSYPVATAKAGFETPDGTWSVIDKVENPTWHNPDPTGWGAGEPLVIPPGPGNPLGTRALYLNAPGIRIHGTPEDSSIGTYASHGCIRMHISDSEALYPLVPVGTPVLVYGGPPWGTSGASGVPGA